MTLESLGDFPPGSGSPTALVSRVRHVGRGGEMASNAAMGDRAIRPHDDDSHMRTLIGREDGQTMPEYAVVLSLLTITAAAVFLALSGGVANAMTSVTGVI